MEQQKAAAGLLQKYREGTLAFWEDYEQYSVLSTACGEDNLPRQFSVKSDGAIVCLARSANREACARVHSVLFLAISADADVRSQLAEMLAGGI